MNTKAFLVASLGQALELGIARPEDVVRHVTPDVLAAHLPRPLWARLLTACLGAAKVDAQLIVETLGVPNLCEHVPSSIMWRCIAEVAQRSLGQDVTYAPTVGAASTASAPVSAPVSAPLSAPPTATRPLTPPPPEVRATPPPAPRPTPPSGTAIPPAPPPAPTPVTPAASSPPASAEPARSRTPTGQRFRPANTGVARLAGNNVRRPQAAATPTSPTTAAPVRGEPAAANAAGTGAFASTARRGSTESDYDVETEIKDDWKSSLAVEDEQLVDWSSNDETVTHDQPIDGRKR